MNIPRLRAPIVLVHGLFGFDRLKIANATMANYFPGIPALLTAAGNRVLVASLSPTAGTRQRGQQLKDFLESASPQEPVHIIAHSLGGLDARYMIAHLAAANKVLTLTTLGTPHRGTVFADWGMARFERLFKPMLEYFGVPYQAFHDLTTSACREFNDCTPDAPGVRYFSVAGQYNGTLLAPGWLLSHAIVRHGEGLNDGVVSQASARWGETFDIWEGDHFHLVNWISVMGYRGLPRDPAPRYGGLVRRLADLGF